RRLSLRVVGGGRDRLGRRRASLRRRSSRVRRRGAAGGHRRRQSRDRGTPRGGRGGRAVVHPPGPSRPPAAPPPPPPPPLPRPDPTGPTASPVAGPPFSFRLRSPTRVHFEWGESRDAELEGYQLTIDGRTTTLSTGSRTAVVSLRTGPHRWSINAYDLSGNR